MGVRLVFLFLNQRVIFIIFSCEIQKSLHIITDIFSFFPHDSYFLLDQRGDRNALHALHGFHQRGVHHGAAGAVLQKLFNGVELAGVHDDIRGDAGVFKAGA